MPRSIVFRSASRRIGAASHGMLRVFGFHLLLAWLVAAFALALFSGPSAVRAEEDPEARLQLVIKSVHVRDDNDIGDGEIRLYASVARCSSITLGSCADSRTIASAVIEFSAGSGETVTLNRVVPRSGDTLAASPNVEGDAFSVFADSSYLVTIEGWERDSLTLNDDLGSAVLALRKAANWEIGSHTLPAWGAYYDGGTRRHEGDFGVTFEIRRAPLPDLVATQFRVVRVEGTDRQIVCMGVSNLGERDTASVPVILRIGSSPPVLRQFNYPGLSAGEWKERCEFTPDIPPGDHPTSFTIDEGRTIPEMNEVNNLYQSRFMFGPPTQAPPPASGPQLTDLAARGISVRGNKPGSQRCEPGANTVSVLVKNEGQKAAPAFKVKLDADGDDYEESLAGLDGGKEVTVTFPNVDLKKGMRNLKVKVDAKNTVDEPDDADNEINITVNCQES